MTKSFALYSYFRSSASYRVRIALYLKNIDFEYRAVHLLNNGGEHHSEAYRKINAAEQVPTLIHDGRIIGESVAILDYLDRVAPSPRLFPEDPFTRALVLQACELVNSSIQPLANLSVLQHLAKRYNLGEAEREEWAQHWHAKGLRALEGFLKSHSGKFAFGDQPCAADCFLMPTFLNVDRFKLTLDPYPTLAQIRASCEAHDAFKKAAPGQQPDSPRT